MGVPDNTSFTAFNRLPVNRSLTFTAKGMLSLLAQVGSPVRRQALLRRGAARNERRLRPGDVIEASIQTEDGAIDLGVQRNEVVLGP